MPSKNQGFTLFELSIVLVIIALLIGGILIGATVIKNAKLQSMMADIDGFNSAIKGFRDKYHYLPGDFPVAQTFWGAATGCPTPVWTNTPNILTCNGDGNGHVGDRWVNTTSDYELFTAWQHLSNAGFVKTTFTGMSGTTNTHDTVPGKNVPASQYENGGYTLLYVQPQNFAGDPNYFDIEYGHIIAFGARAAGDFTRQPVLTPGEAYLVDSKMDDGRPASGTVIAGKSALMPNCTTSDTASISTYNATYPNAACALFFITGL